MAKAPTAGRPSPPMMMGARNHSIRSTSPQRRKLPATWPGVPLLIDSPEYPTALKGDTVDVTIPLSLIGGIKGASYDGVTAGLKINGNLHSPLLCVDNVFKVASGNLSLPGKVMPAK